jgi:hypothetical protein
VLTKKETSKTAIVHIQDVHERVFVVNVLLIIDLMENFLNVIFQRKMRKVGIDRLKTSSPSTSR